MQSAPWCPATLESESARRNVDWQESVQPLRGVAVAQLQILNPQILHILPSVECGVHVWVVWTDLTPIL